MPFFLIGAVVLGIGYLWWQSSHQYPEVPPNADALTLLNFPAFMLRTGKKTFAYVMAPEGLSEMQAQTIGGDNFKITGANVTRKHIPLPGPSTVPAFADLWAIEFVYPGPDKVITPASLLQEQGIPEAATQVDPNRQLAGILYATSFNPTLGKILFIPIAAKQV